MKLMNDVFAGLKRADAPLYKSPKSLQQAIEIRAVYPNGIFDLGGGKFSKMYLFSDINYATADEEEQEGIFSQYCSFLNSLDVNYKITLNNKSRNMERFRKEILLAEKGDDLDECRREMNAVIEGKMAESRQGIEQERYLTVTIERRTEEEARLFFHTLEVSISKEFAALGSEIVPLDGSERLHILFDFYHGGREQVMGFGEYAFTAMRELKAQNATDAEDYHDFRNDLCNGMLQFYPDYFKDEAKFRRALFIKKYPNSLSDRFLNEIMSLPAHIIASIDVVPIPKDVTVRALQKKYMGIEKDIAKQQQVRNRNSDYSSGISYTKRMEKKDIEDLMDDVRDNDKSLFFVGVTFVVSADTKEELDSLCETVVTIGKHHSCVIDRQYLMQREALNTTLPIGVRQVETMRTLLTDSLAVLMPFNARELNEKNGVYYGVNMVSKNLLIGNRKKLVNGNGFVFGVPGSGKSFFSKTEIEQVLLGTDDEVIVIDPQNEYFELAEKFHGSVINFSLDTEHYLNPMDVNVYELDATDSSGVIREKSEFMLGFIEQAFGEAPTIRERAVIDRCVRNIYFRIAKERPENRKVPTLADFHHELCRQQEEQAQALAMGLELYTSGSLNIFTHETNVDINNRFTVFGIRDLGKELAPISMLVMMENIGRRIAENAERGRATWLYIDECHVLLDKEYTGKYLFELWKKVRKQGGLCTGITQNAIDLMQNYTALTMLANSEFIVLLRQSQQDIRKLTENLGISPAQIRYVTGAESGKGLIKHGEAIVPFDITVEKGSRVYEMFNTNLHEKAGMKE